MAHRLLTETAVSTSELQQNPVATVAAAEGMPVVVTPMPVWRMARNRCGSASMSFAVAFHLKALGMGQRLMLESGSVQEEAGSMADPPPHAHKQAAWRRFRLVHELRDQQQLLLVVAVGKRNLHPGRRSWARRVPRAHARGSGSAQCLGICTRGGTQRYLRPKASTQPCKQGIAAYR